MLARYARIRSTAMWLLAALFLAGGSIAAAAERPKAAAKCFPFPAAGLTFDADFSAARLDACTRTADGRYQLLFRAETTPINNSAWYAFRVRSEKPQAIEVELTYQGGSHRYVPRISRDGKSWTRLTGTAYQQAKGKPPRLRLEVGPQPLWVAAQELLAADDLYGWARRMAQAAEARPSVLGQSVGARPLLAWNLGSAASVDQVVILGRQHPPEVTGSLGLMAFVDRLAESDDLARRFRQRFQVLVVPLMNPDGVELGHWRCNVNRVDLNRDWLKFSQPETRAVRDEIQRLVSAGKRLRVLLDFHSTGHDVLYTQRDNDPTVPENFTRRWLAAIEKGLPGYQLRRDGAHGTKLATCKAWGYETFRIPAITYEVGDNTDRALIRTVARTAAEALMRILLSDAEQGKLPTTNGLQRAAIRRAG